MALRLRTQTVPNHVSGHRDMKWGLDVLIPLSALFAGGFAAWVSLRVDVQAVKTQRESDEIVLEKRIDLRVRTLDEDRPTRREFDEIHNEVQEVAKQCCKEK